MNGNQIVTDRFSNPESENLYHTAWQSEPDTAVNFYYNGKQCGGCSFYAEFNSDWGLCCHPDSRHHLETVFEHFTCPTYVEEGWDSHSFLTEPHRKLLDEFDKRGIRICQLVTAYITANNLGIVTDQDTTYVLHEHIQPFKPDLGFIARGREVKFHDTSYLIAPDLAIIIVTSRVTAQLLQHEVMMYLQSGTREVWVVYNSDYLLPSICIYTLTPELAFKANILTKGDTLDESKVLPGFRVPIREIF